MKVHANQHVLGFPHGSKFLVFAIERIIRIEALDNYSRVHFTDHPPILMARVLRAYEHLLGSQGFIRTHKSHLVNIRHILELEKDGRLLMTDHSHAAISRRKRTHVRHTLLHVHHAA